MVEPAGTYVPANIVRLGHHDRQARPPRLGSSFDRGTRTAREQLRTLDLLFNPNVLYVLVPLLLVVILTKLVNTNDPTVQKEMQQMNILNPQQQLPDMSEVSYFFLFLA
ncbi:unnamed protein product [Schistosoma curassoni]|uniref:ER membrane protein complex subunit 7 n=1 Tax=Schistosoma curassoni TaxID=6186 RepID=A0A183L2L8_9TREM|nr:unnamed protein product [Schistosoma curassoni]